MEFRIDKDFAQPAENLLRGLYYHNYLFDSGKNKTSSSKDILECHPELFDSGQFTNLDYNNYPDNDHEKIRLFRIFSSDLIQTSRNSERFDNIKNEINKQTRQAENKGVSLFNLTSKIKTEKEREARGKLAKKYKELSGELLPKLEFIIEKRNQTSNELGFNTYSDQACILNRIDLVEIENNCRQLLNDTEYIYRDLLKWQLKHKLELQIENSGYEDLLILFNSYEFKDYFKQTSALNLSTGFLNELGINLSGAVNFDISGRKSKNYKARTYPVEIPNNILISIYRIKTIEDYEAILGELGQSLLFSTVNMDESFESKRLHDPAVLQTFKMLFQDLVFEQKWLQRYLRIDTDRNFLEFLYLKKLFQIRELCLKALSYRVIHENPIHEALQQISELYPRDAFVKPNENLILFDLVFYDTNPYIDYRACLLESNLREFLISRFDEQWWRETEAGTHLIRWWNKNSELTPGFIEQELEQEMDMNALNNRKLIKYFEKAF